MDRTDLVRLRWRLTGAWLWPCFVVLTVVDAGIIHTLPPAGDSTSVISAWLLGSALMLLGMVLFSPVGGALLRRGRRDMPKTVARNYAGTFALFGVSLAFLVAGLVHHAEITTDRSAQVDAAQRAKAWVGDQSRLAPYQVNMDHPTSFPIQPPDIYRICEPNLAATRYYCVVVDRTKPFGKDVTGAGTESNQLLEQGAS